jgi:glyoxylase I family protein
MCPGVRRAPASIVSIGGFDLDRSPSSYRLLLGPLGNVRASEIVGERGERVVYLGGPGVVSVSLRAAQTSGAHDRYRIGIHHAVFAAPSREVADERLRWVREQGLEVENDPREYDYSRGYYAGFHHDRDGIKLEVVHAP